MLSKLFKETELYEVMKADDCYFNDEDIDSTLEGMCQEINDGEDIGDVLSSQGLEFDYAMDLLLYMSDV